ncbi:NADH dehydrogenase, partial [Listeria monocytogenes FSL F2-208]
MMNNIILMPILIPFLGAITLMLLPKKVIIQRVFALIFSGILVVATLGLVFYIRENGITTVNIGNWAAPFGITMVGDMLAVLLTATTSIVLFCVILYSFYTIGKPREKFLY